LQGDQPLEDWEFPEPDEDEGLSETRTCPSCGAAVYEDAEQCPACGEYVVLSHAAILGWPWWLVALGLVGILATILALALG
jgi:ribosomal protein S27AE